MSARSLVRIVEYLDTENPAALPAGHYLHIQVTDCGTGIPPAQLTRIFDPYFTTKQKGTGLGMAIVKRIIEAHRGRIRVESTVGKGTAFYVKLPAATSPPVSFAAQTQTAGDLVARAF